MLHLISKAFNWSLTITFSLLSVVRLLVVYITKFPSQPWTPKDRPNPPPCLSDPKYGKHKFFQSNGLRLHYVEAGDRNKPLMIFLHGFPEFWFCWRHQIPEFSKDFWTIALDMRGYNLSERPTGVDNYKMSCMVEDLRALIEHLNRKQCILVCHDWGTIVGSAFIAKHENMVQKYILMGAPPRDVFRKLFQTTLDQFKRSWYIFFFQMPIIPELMMTCDDLVAFDKMFNSRRNQELTDEYLEAYKYVYSQPGAFTGGINYYRANFSRPDGDRNDGNAGRKTDGSNGMFVLGEFDKFISPKSLSMTAKVHPKMRVEVVPKVGHFLQHQAPTATNALIRDFLGPASDFPIDTFK